MHNYVDPLPPPTNVTLDGIQVYRTSVIFYFSWPWDNSGSIKQSECVSSGYHVLLDCGGVCIYYPLISYFPRGTNMIKFYNTDYNIVLSGQCHFIFLSFMCSGDYIRLSDSVNITFKGTKIIMYACYHDIVCSVFMYDAFVIPVGI